MRTTEITLYKFNELSEDSQQAAYQEWISGGPDNSHVAYEAIDSLKAFADVFPVKITNWSLGSYRSHIDLEFTGDQDIAELSGQRLATYIYNNFWESITSRKYFKSFTRPASDPVLRHRKLTHKILQYGPNKGAHFYQYYGLKREFGHCPLTGVCYDADLLTPIEDFLQSPDSTTTFFDLLESCASELASSVQKECEYNESFAAFEDWSSANDREYTEDGELY